jgi:hypothetical protein
VGRVGLVVAVLVVGASLGVPFAAAAAPWDDSVGSTTLVVASNAYASPGYSGNSMTLNGTSTGVGRMPDVSDFRQVCDMSFGGWYLRTSTTPADPIFALRYNATGSTQWRLNLDGANHPRFMAGATATATTSMAVNTWYHIAGTYDCDGGGVTTIYVNGTAEATTAGTGTFAARYNEEPIWVGYQDNTPGRELPGMIDNMTAYNGTWTSGEVASFHTGTQPPAHHAYYFETPGGGGGGPVAPARCVDHVVTVASERGEVWRAPDGLPSCYSFNLVNPPFNSSVPNGTVAQFAVQVNQDAGTWAADPVPPFLEPRELQTVSVHYYVANATTTREIRVDTVLRQVPLTKLIDIKQYAYLDGVQKWVSESLVGRGSVRFQSSSLVGWAVGNVTLFTDASGPVINPAHEQRTEFVVFPPTNFTGGTLYFMPSNTADSFWQGGGNGTARLATGNEAWMFYLGNMSGPVDVWVTTDAPSFQDVEAMNIHSVFLTPGGRGTFASENGADPCPGFKSLFRKAFGFCPSVEGMVFFIGDKTANVTASLLGVVPGLGGISEDVGGLVGLILGLYSFGLLLIVTDPLRLFLVITGHLFLWGCIVGAFEGSLRTPFTFTWSGLKVTWIVTKYYVGAVFYMLKFVWGILTWVLHTAVVAVRG